jgi:hypothetical protein
MSLQQWHSIADCRLFPVTAINHSCNTEPGDAACGSLCWGLNWPAAGPPGIRAFG